jgi:hypothetical protein
MATNNTAEIIHKAVRIFQMSPRIEFEASQISKMSALSRTISAKQSFLFLLSALVKRLACGHQHQWQHKTAHFT